MTAYACSDLHGQYDLYEKIKAFLQPDDVVYFLGDATDRGPRSWELFKTIVEDEQFIYICGNHEKMLRDAIHEYNKGDNYNYSYEIQILFANGGASTFEGWKNETLENREKWRKVLNYDLTWDEVYFSPSGVLFYLNHSGEHEEAKIDEKLWSREHFFEDYCSSADYIIHGHTPIPSMLDLFKKFHYSDYDILDDGAIIYGKERKKINIDAGAFVTNKTILFDMDNFKSIIIE